MYWARTSHSSDANEPVSSDPVSGDVLTCSAKQHIGGVATLLELSALVRTRAADGAAAGTPLPMACSTALLPAALPQRAFTWDGVNFEGRDVISARQTSRQFRTYVKILATADDSLKKVGKMVDADGYIVERSLVAPLIKAAAAVGLEVSVTADGHLSSSMFHDLVQNHMQKLEQRTKDLEHDIERRSHELHALLASTFGLPAPADATCISPALAGQLELVEVVATGAVARLESACDPTALSAHGPEAPKWCDIALAELTGALVGIVLNHLDMVCPTGLKTVSAFMRRSTCKLRGLEKDCCGQAEDPAGSRCMSCFPTHWRTTSPFSRRGCSERVRMKASPSARHAPCLILVREHHAMAGDTRIWI